MRFDNGFGDCQAETRVSLRAGAGFINPVETLENVREIIGRDPFPRVAY